MTRTRLERLGDQQLRDLLAETRKARATIGVMWKQRATQLAQLEAALRAELDRRTTTRT